MSLQDSRRIQTLKTRVTVLEHRIELLTTLALALAADRKTEAVVQARLAIVPDFEEAQEAS